MRPFSFWHADAAPVVPIILTGQWRNYAGAPWVSVPTTDDLADTGDNPTVGTSQNGHASADFDGSSQWLLSDASNLTTLFNDASGSIYVLFQAVSAITDPGGDRDGNVGDDIPNLAAQKPLGSDRSLRVAYSSAGVHAMIYSGGSWHEVHVAASTGTPHLAQVRWDGALLSLRINGGAWSTVAAGNITTWWNELQVGRECFGHVYFDGQIWEIGTSDQTATNDQFDAILASVRDYYDLALP